MSSPCTPWPADLCTRARWSTQKSFNPVTVIGETPKRYRVRLERDMRLPGRLRSGKAGDVILVPKYAVSPRQP